MSSIASTADFLAAVERANLLAPEQAEKLGSDAVQAAPDARAAAQELVRRGWLTSFQIDQIFLERGPELVLGSYVLLDRIGEGAMGEIYKARHQTMNRVVALKALRKERLAHPDAVQRFRREIRAAAQLSHPRFVMIFDADECNGTHFYVMEYIAGTDLSQLVKKKGPLPIARACEYIYQTAEGLEYAHERGLVHRDLKPANLLVRSDTSPPEIKILDMGLARLVTLAGDDESSLTHEGRVVGTPDYIAPEQARNSRVVDVRADLYSLGCTMYVLLTAHVPFPGGASVMEKLMKHQMEDPVPIETLRPEVPEPVRAVLRRLITRNVDDRFPTPADLMTALQPLRMSPATARRSARIARPAPEPAEPQLAPGAEPKTPHPGHRETAAAKEGITERWFYLHEGKVCGPILSSDVKARATRGELLPDDLIWPMGVEPQYAVMAAAAIDFATLKPAPAPAVKPAPAPALKPAWLEDVKKEAEAQKPVASDSSGEIKKKRTTTKKDAPPAQQPPQSQQQPGVPAPPATPTGLPNWLADVEMDEQLRLKQTRAAQARAEQLRTNPPTGLPDWIDDIRKLEQ